MDLLLVFVKGAFRVAQSTINKKVSNYTVNFDQKLYFGVLFETAAAIFSFFYLFLTNFNGFGVPTLFFSFLTGIGFLFELLTSFGALNRAPIGLCIICSLGGSIVFPAVLGIFLFHESLSLLQWIGVMLFLFAAWLMTPKNSDKSSFVLKSALPYLVSNFFINGTLSIISKYYAVYVDNANPALFSCCSYAIAAVSFLCIFFFKSRKSKPSVVQEFPKKIYGYSGILGAVCSTIVFLSVFLAKTVPIVILNTVPSAICIVGSSFIGLFIFKEKITKDNIFGTLLSVISIVGVIYY